MTERYSIGPVCVLALMGPLDYIGRVAEYKDEHRILGAQQQAFVLGLHFSPCTEGGLSHHLLK